MGVGGRRRRAKAPSALSQPVDTDAAQPSTGGRASRFSAVPRDRDFEMISLLWGVAQAIDTVDGAANEA
jgi:hypothetical protein